jgi:hypothetical protein
VHAESDLEGLVESPLFQARPHLVAPVDWESTERSVARVIDHLVAERLVPGEVR